MNIATRDIILFVITLVFLAVIFLPDGKNTLETDNAKSDSIKKNNTSDTGNNDLSTKSKEDYDGASEPVFDVEHKLFPFVKGSKWIYKVVGSDKMVPTKEWSLQIISVPTLEVSGEILVGFGDDLKVRHIWLEDNHVKFDGLPFVEPLEFLDNEPTAVSGTFLPPIRYIIEGAVWKQIYTRDLIYDSPDRHGKIHRQKALGTQSDRAMVRRMEDVMVPAGVFKSHKIDWTGRIEIKANKRKVLAPLTSDLFREDTIWMAPGIGMVRRKIVYTKSLEEVIYFDLISYDRPK